MSNSGEDGMSPRGAGLVAADMLVHADETAEFLKSLSHPARLMILFRLAEGPARVGELEDMLSLPQAAVSKQLTRLREESFVDCRREGRSIIYSLIDGRARRLVHYLYLEYCAGSAAT